MASDSPLTAGHEISALDSIETEDTTVEFRRAVIRGLSAPLKTLECKYFYDEIGSELFDQICSTPEYYPTRTEIEILTGCASEIAESVGEGVEIIELGSGASLKTRLLLDAFYRPRAYVPVDISAEYMWQAAMALKHDFPLLDIVPAVADFSKPLHIEQCGGAGNRLLFFPGSTIGNFKTSEAVDLLARMLHDLTPDYFVIGFDLVKERKILEDAYDDAAGITAAFNLNLLRRINTELDGAFDISGFRHEARYNETKNRVEMHIVSLGAQSVRIGALEVTFASGESIHTENCYKYSCVSFEALAAEAGWRMERVWTDKKDLFAVALLKPADGGE